MIVIICFNFFLIHLAPGDPIIHLIGDAQASEEFIRQLRAQYGLDRPIYEQLAIYLFHMLQGDLGYSLVSRERVSAIMLSRLPATLLLLGTQYVLAIAIGMPVLTYVTFEMWFLVPLPKGPIEEMLGL